MLILSFVFCRYVTGPFNAVGGNLNTQNIASWDGQQWSTLGSKSSTVLSTYGSALVMFQNKLYDAMHKKKGFVFEGLFFQIEKLGLLEEDLEALEVEQMQA